MKNAQIQQIEEQHRREEEQLHYFGQMLNADTARVLADACAQYAVSTLGRDRAIAKDLANIFAPAAIQPVTSAEVEKELPRSFPDFRDYPRSQSTDGDLDTFGRVLRPGT